MKTWTAKEYFKEFYESESIKCTCETCSMEHECLFSWNCTNQNGECISDEYGDLEKIDKLNKRRLYALLEMLAWKKIFYENLLEDEIKNFRVSRDTFIDDFRWKVGKVERWETKLKETAKRWRVVCPNP